MPGPLQGVKVLEFTEIVAGPMAGMLLADMGADVIKVEPPWGEPWRSVQSFRPNESRPFIAYNRGKRSLPLDLTAPEASGVLERLVPRMDVVLVNYRPDSAARLGVDYDTLAALNPRLIYCDNTAFGREGPDADKPGYDLILQAMSGLMAAEGKVGRGAPQHIWSTPLIDATAGVCQAWCVCGALFSRERDGKGQKIETSLLGTALALLGMRFVQVESLDRVPHARTLEELTAMRAAGLTYAEQLALYQGDHLEAPGDIYYRMYTTSDGAIGVGCLSDRLRLRLLETLGLRDRRFDPGYDPATQESIAFGHALTEQAEDLFRQRTTDEWLSLLEQQGIPAGPVRFVEELFDDPQARANGLVAEIDHPEAGKVRMVGPLARFSETPLTASSSPSLGQHTREILEDLGYSALEIQRWIEAGIVS